MHNEIKTRFILSQSTWYDVLKPLPLELNFLVSNSQRVGFHQQWFPLIYQSLAFFTSIQICLDPHISYLIMRIGELIIELLSLTSLARCSNIEASTKDAEHVIHHTCLLRSVEGKTRKYFPLWKFSLHLFDVKLKKGWIQNLLIYFSLIFHPSRIDNNFPSFLQSQLLTETVKLQTRKEATVRSQPGLIATRRRPSSASLLRGNNQANLMALRGGLATTSNKEASQPQGLDTTLQWLDLAMTARLAMTPTTVLPNEFFSTYFLSLFFLLLSFQQG